MKAKSLIKLINVKNYSVSPWFLKAIRKENISVDELILLLYFANLNEKVLNIDNIVKELGFTSEEVLSIFSSLINKKLIELENKKDENNKIKEVISLNKIEDTIMDMALEEDKKSVTTSIFTTFESEFGRTLSPMEYEIINAWLQNNVSEELIVGALKEATYNNVRSLRYIDKIIYEWGKKGFKNMQEVNASLTKKKEMPHEELFEYDWLDDESK